jgi:hypothetical protein
MTKMTDTRDVGRTQRRRLEDLVIELHKRYCNRTVVTVLEVLAALTFSVVLALRLLKF